MSRDEQTDIQYWITAAGHLRKKLLDREAEIEQLRLACDCHPESICANNKRLRAQIEQLRELSRCECDDECALSIENERLRAALQPFARNVKAISLSGALGHITREDLHNARAALEPQP